MSSTTRYSGGVFKGHQAQQRKLPHIFNYLFITANLGIGGYLLYTSMKINSDLSSKGCKLQVKVEEQTNQVNLDTSVHDEIKNLLNILMILGTGLVVSSATLAAMIAFGNYQFSQAHFTVFALTLFAVGVTTLVTASILTSKEKEGVCEIVKEDTQQILYMGIALTVVGVIAVGIRFGYKFHTGKIEKVIESERKASLSALASEQAAGKERLKTAATEKEDARRQASEAKKKQKESDRELLRMAEESKQHAIERLMAARSKVEVEDR